MSATVEQFCEKLKSDLNGLEDRFATLTSNVKALSKQGEQSLQKGLDEARIKIAAGKEKMEQVQANLKENIRHKLNQTQEAVSEWKAKRQTKKLDSRAELAEGYAVDAIYYAAAMLEQADEAIFEAALARSESNNAHSPALSTK